MTKRFAILLTGTLLLSAGCASTRAPQPEDTPKMYSSPTQSGEPVCATMYDEVVELDSMLGAPALETPIPPPPSTLAKVGAYSRDLVVQTVIGPIQPIIQTWRAVTNAETKERNAELGYERAITRRAYLLGAMESAGCGVEILTP